MARGAACPRARDAQDTTKQTGAFSLPLFLYISGREAWQSSCQVLRTLRPIADAILVRVLNILFLFCLRSSSRRKVAPLSTNYCAYIRRRRLQRLLSSPTRQKSSSDLQLSLNLSGVIRLRYELMCLISGKNNDGEIHPLIFCPSFMRKRLAFSFCCAFLFSFCARGRLPPRPRCPRYH